MKMSFVSAAGFVSCISCAALVVACGNDSVRATNETESRVTISGGKNAAGLAPAGITRSTIALANNADFYNDSLNHRSAYCSGVVLTKNLILTAAHCAQDLGKTRYLASFATDMKTARKNTAALTREISQAIKHPGYPDVVEHRVGYDMVTNAFIDSPDKWMAANPGKAPHDIAILYFKGGLPEGFEPVKMAAQDEFSTDVTLAGFGVTSVSNISDTGVLRFVDGVKAKKPEGDAASRNFIMTGKTVDVSDMAKGARPLGACPGDSGGPSFISKDGALLLSGILSLGESERLTDTTSWSYCGGHKTGATERDFNVYIDVRAYSGWINETIAAFADK